MQLANLRYNFDVNKRKVFLFLIYGLGVFLLLSNFVQTIILDSNIHQIDFELRDLKASNKELSEEIKELKSAATKSNSVLNDHETSINENTFFLHNEKEYKFLNERVRLHHCCTSSLIHNDKLLGYDLLLEDPIGSGNYFDFGTSSYISFNKNDVIKNIDIQQLPGVPNKPIYKISIDSNYRYTEGIVYPQYDASSTWYHRLYELTNDSFDYKAEVESINNGYKVTVTSSLPSKPIGEYILRNMGTGYSVEIIQDIN